jgi:hypothetical protein
LEGENEPLEIYAYARIYQRLRSPPRSANLTWSFSHILQSVSHPVTIYLIPLFTMANARALTACLTRLGFDIPTRELIDRQGIRTLGDLTALPFPEIEKMIQHLSRWKPRDSGAEGEDDPAPTFPY